MVSDMIDRKGFSERLLAQDPPSVDEQARHRDALFNAAKRRMCIEKVVTGGAYVLVFVVAFLAFLARAQTDVVVHAICWGALSLHILLWFLVYFVWRINALLAKTAQTAPTGSAAGERLGSERKIQVAALIMLAFTTLLLVLGFSLTDPLKASQMTVLMLWGPMFFLEWYAFGAGSLASKLWLVHKELELRANRPDDEEH